MEFVEYLTAFNTSLKVRICLVLGNGEFSVDVILGRLSDKFKETRNRETVYRALEALVKHDIVDKKYRKDDKRIVYSLKAKRVVVDFIAQNLDIQG